MSEEFYKNIYKEYKRYSSIRKILDFDSISKSNKNTSFNKIFNYLEKIKKNGKLIQGDDMYHYVYIYNGEQIFYFHLSEEGKHRINPYRWPSTLYLEEKMYDFFDGYIFNDREIKEFCLRYLEEEFGFSDFNKNKVYYNDIIYNMKNIKD